MSRGVKAALSRLPRRLYRSPVFPKLRRSITPPPCSGQGLRTAILLTGNALYGKGLATAGRIGQATGAKLLAPYALTRLERGSGLPPVDRVAYVLEQGVEQFKEFRQLILVGCASAGRVFCLPGKEVAFTSPECEIHTLAIPGKTSARSRQSKQL